MQRPPQGPYAGLAILLASALLAWVAQAAAPAAEVTDHVAAAQRWERAAGTGAAAAAPLAQAARQWLLAHRVAEAERVAARLVRLERLDPRSPAGTARGLAVAEVALAAAQPDRTLAALRALGEPPPAGAEAQVLLLRGQAYLMSGRIPEGVRALVARERYLAPAALAGARHLLWDALAEASARGQDISVPRGADAIVGGWLELARAARHGSGPPARREQVSAWRNRYPAHPAAALIADAMPDQAVPAAPPPPGAIDATRTPARPATGAREPVVAAPPPARNTTQIALLVPLSGRLSEAGEALRDGFMSAYFQQDESTRPTVRIYDTAADPAGAYRRAADEGAGFVIGPLGKENVLAVRAVADGKVQVLALNVLPDGEAAPRRFYQFALSPEDEARQVAERLLAEGKRTGVALVAAGEWGDRVAGAFRAAFTAGGGHLVTSLTFGASTTDFSDTLVPLLGFEDSQRRYKTIAALVGGSLQFNPRRRDDLEFVFFGGQPVHGRLVRQQLKFYYAGDLPVYSLSDVYELNPAANQDLQGVAFVDMPWMTADTPALTELRANVAQLWPTTARRWGRLFSMGHDAALLVAELRRSGLPITEPIAGLTGRLTVDAGGRVHRTLEWARIGSDGLPHPLTADDASEP